MNIFITLDYELFFGSMSGTAQQCMIEPTQALLDILDPYGIKASFFVDTGYLYALSRQKDEYDQVREDFESIWAQLKKLTEDGHGLELHVHPHWEDSYFDGQKWIMDTSRYKLSDFSDTEVVDIITKHVALLTDISAVKPTAYRAGGWCVQPFPNIAKALKKNNIEIDSSVYPGGYYCSENQQFDFREAPRFITEYTFEEHPTIPKENGSFTEIPISSLRVQPTFYWRFAIHKLRQATQHRPFGNGNPVTGPFSEKIRLLTRPSFSVVSIDGYKSTLLKKALKLYSKKAGSHPNLVLIGHPKAFTPYSLRKLKQFIEETRRSHNYTTFRKYLNTAKTFG